MRFSFFKEISNNLPDPITKFVPKPQDLCLLIGEDLNHRKIYLPESRSLSKLFDYWYHRLSGKRLAQCILLPNS